MEMQSTNKYIHPPLFHKGIVMTNELLLRNLSGLLMKKVGYISTFEGFILLSLLLVNYNSYIVYKHTVRRTSPSFVFLVYA